MTQGATAPARRRPASDTSWWLWAGGALATALVVGVALSTTLQIALVALGLIAAVVIRSRKGVLLLAVVLIPTTGLIRRLAAGPEARQDSDPLLLLPLVLLLAVVIFSLTTPRTDKRGGAMRFAAAATVVGIAASILLTSTFTVDVIFYAALVIVPLFAALMIGNGKIPPVWPTVQRVLPGLAVAVGTYGIAQFFLLPSWDRAWMLSSKLTSIGHAVPREVRVFAASESPGPFALFLGVTLTVCLYVTVVERSGARRFPWLVLSLYLAVPLLLTGVRSALIGVAFCALVLALVRARGVTRILVVAFLVGVYYLLNAVIARFGAGSTILSADRYTQFSGTDDSLVARLTLLNYLRNPFQHIIGAPAAPRFDNLYVDVLVNYGILPAAALFVLVGGLTIVSLRNLVRSHNEAASLAFLFIATQTMFGNVFGSLFGLLVGIVVGTVLTRQPAEPKEPQGPKLSRTYQRLQTTTKAPERTSAR